MTGNAIQKFAQGGDDAGGARTGGGEDALAQIVRLFAPSRERSNGDNWTATLSLIQGVAKQVREMHLNAHAMVEESNRNLREARTETLAAEEQAEQYRGEAELARNRADHAEARVQALTHELHDAERRIEEADQRIAELSVWLRRVHDCMEDEFSNLTIQPLNGQRG